MKKLEFRISNLTKDCNSAVEAESPILEGTTTTFPHQNWVQTGIAFLLSATAHKGMVALADQAVVSAANFLTGVIIGRACAKEEFGLYMLGFSIVLFVTDLQTSLISTPYMVYSPRLRGSAHAQYTGSTLIHQLGLSVLAILCLVVAGAALSLGVGPQGLAPVTWILAVVITFIMLRDYARQVCFTGLRMKTALLLDSCVSVIQIGGLLVLVYLGVLSTSRAYLVVGGACGIAALGWLIWMRKQFILRLSKSLSHLAGNWSLGKWVFASALVATLATYLYPWILTGFHGAASTGVWAACLGVVSIHNPLLFGVYNFLGPKTAHAYAKSVGELRRVVLKATVFLAATVGVFCLAIIVFGDQLVTMIYGSRYEGNGAVVSVMALSIFAHALASGAAYGLTAMERPDVNFKVNLIALGVTITLGVWLVRLLGPLGAACGLLVGNTARSAIRYLVYARVVCSAARR